jgi:hypothetical protein
VPADEAFRIASGNVLDFFHLRDTPVGGRRWPRCHDPAAPGGVHGRREARTMGRAVTVRWVKGMKIEGAAGPHRLVMDAPAEAGGGDEAPSPAELLLGAIGA